MIVECIMCHEEYAIEDIVLRGDRAVVKVWPCEGCAEAVAEFVEESYNC